MSVFVDENGFMIADTSAELEKMAQKLGLRKAGRRGAGQSYELTPRQQKLALAFGVKSVSEQELVRIMLKRVTR